MGIRRLEVSRFDVVIIVELYFLFIIVHDVDAISDPVDTTLVYSLQPIAFSLFVLEVVFVFCLVGASKCTSNGVRI